MKKVQNKKNIAIILISFVFVVTGACMTPATQIVNTPIPIEKIIELTSSVAQTQTATVSGGQPQALELTNTPVFAETPSASLAGTYVYEGMTASCVVDNAFCSTNIVFLARVTIDEQGNVTGVFDKYLADTPPIEFSGTTTNLYGLLINNGAPGVKEERIEFVGSISNNLSMLEGSITSSGVWMVDENHTFSGLPFSAKRTMILFRK